MQYTRVFVSYTSELKFLQKSSLRNEPFLPKRHGWYENNSDIKMLLIFNGAI